MKGVFLMKYILLLMDIVIYFFTMEFTIGELTYTMLDLTIVVAVVTVLCVVIRHFFIDN